MIFKSRTIEHVSDDLPTQKSSCLAHLLQESDTLSLRSSTANSLRNLTFKHGGGEVWPLLSGGGGRRKFIFCCFKESVIHGTSLYISFGISSSKPSIEGRTTTWSLGILKLGSFRRSPTSNS